ncbi:hypothetical protein PAXRUDRAFT_19743 [Paxillus rubicundulus Ve08.2h10]|uniref:Uncharacterized protein n=1 Tax=Paxillus rubicundulus Ve08.2h10 TaxID=930991 RepID=A0A0D0CU19_9AGAM|nr:hypothetical protein PAXRUDRAFT_19743 [Paxillus rubicundulus Ve08.2h10]
MTPSHYFNPKPSNSNDHSMLSQHYMITPILMSLLLNLVTAHKHHQTLTLVLCVLRVTLVLPPHPTKQDPA